MQHAQLLPTWAAADPVKKRGQGRQVLAHSLTHLRHNTRAQVGNVTMLHAQGNSGGTKPASCCAHVGLGASGLGLHIVVRSSSRQANCAAMQQQQHNTQAAKPVRTGLASANTRKVGVPTTFAAAASSYNREQKVLRCLPSTSWKSQQHA